MYRDQFRLSERPFTHAPGKRFFAASSATSEALTHLQHVLTARDSIAVLTGGPGVGKTTLAECAIAAIPDRVTVARVDLRYGEPEDLYAAILLAIGEEANAPRPVHALHALRHAMARFVREDQRLVLCLDVGSISTEVARHLLRVANLAGEHDCQMNIVLMGPHPLHQQLDLPALIQLRQRIAFRHRVRPLTLADTDRYIRHEIEAAGGDPTALVSSNLAAAVYCYVAGVPRLINTLLDAVFTDACLQKVERPDGNQVRRTAEALGWKPMTPASSQDAAQKAGATARPAPPRSAPPKVAIISAAAADRERQRSTQAPDKPAGEGRRVDLPPPSEMTLQLRRTAEGGDTSATGRFAAISLATEARSPTAEVFGSTEPAPRPVPAVPLIAMDATDTGATGMLRLQDLDERFAETIFGKEAEDAGHKREK